MDYICELSTKVESFLTNPSPPTAKVVPTKPSTVEEVPTPPSYSTPPSGCPPTQPSTAYQLKKKVLYVSDSVGRTVEFPIVEKEMKCTVRTAKAYSSIEDKKALWPTRNFTDVVKANLA